MKYKKWLDEWLLTFVFPLKKDRTAKKYAWIADKKLAPHLGDYEMRNLDAVVLQKFISIMISQHSAGTVRGIITVLNGSLKTAVKLGIVERQYSDCIIGPKTEEKSVVCFTRDEQKRIEDYIISKNDDKLIGILICLYTGIRIGELFALTWSDIDLKNALLDVGKSCHDGWGAGGYHKIIEAPKTRMSRRIIPIPKQLLPYLKKLKKKAVCEFVIYGKSKPISIRSYQRTFERLLQKIDIPHKGFHALRHTFATRAIECGMDVKTLSEVLGHKNPSITLNRYTHSLMEYKSEMMNKIGRLLQ